MANNTLRTCSKEDRTSHDHMLVLATIFDIFFDYMETSKPKKVKFVTYKLKNGLWHVENGYKLPYGHGNE